MDSNSKYPNDGYLVKSLNCFLQDFILYFSCHKIETEIVYGNQIQKLRPSGR